MREWRPRAGCRLRTVLLIERAHGVDVDLQLYPEGHHANAVDERVRHMQLILDFFARYP